MSWHTVAFVTEWFAFTRRKTCIVQSFFILDGCIWVVLLLKHPCWCNLSREGKHVFLDLTVQTNDLISSVIELAGRLKKLSAR